MSDGDRSLIEAALKAERDAKRLVTRCQVAKIRAERKARGGCVDCATGIPEAAQFSRCNRCRRRRDRRLKKTA